MKLGGAFLAACCFLAAQPAAQSTPSLEQLLDRMGAYLTEYETQLSSMVADERFEQNVYSGRGRTGALLESVPPVRHGRADCSPIGMKFASVLLIGLLTAAQPAGLDAVLERLDDYLDQYETQLSAVVADEELIQETGGRMFRRINQRLRSEIAFLRLPGGLEWMGFRRVRSINGKPLTSTKTLAEVLAITSSDALQQASILVDESAKYNLGNPRTTNMPNLPLELLSRKYRHRYEVNHQGRANVRGHATDEIELIEIGEQPIVHNEGRQMKTRVRAWIDSRSGALWRAEVEMRVPRDSRNPTWLRVDFALDNALQIMVPVTMRERFNSIADTGTSLATYTNFRRFQTSARIVPQP